MKQEGVARSDQGHPVSAGVQSRDSTVIDTGRYKGLLKISDANDDTRPTTDGYHADLNLDQIIDALVNDREEPSYLRHLFNQRTGDVDVINYRHEVFRDLNDEVLLDAVKNFADDMRQVRLRITQCSSMRYEFQQAGWFLHAASTYCDAVTSLASELGVAQVTSRGLRDFRHLLDQYVTSEHFRALERETDDCLSSLGAVQYEIRIKAGHVDVYRFEQEGDYSEAVLETFERFKQGAVKDYRVVYRGWPGMDHIAAQIVERVAKLFPEEFATLAEYVSHHRDFFDPDIRQFERELQFYLAFLDYVAPIKIAGLNFCFSKVSTDTKAVMARDVFDLALAKILVEEHMPVVCNDWELAGKERIFVVSGPNQGGKTTFSRTFGQLHHFASIGCPVPGTKSELYLFDRLFAHFEREEDLDNMHGKLEDDLVRIHSALKQATSKSIMIMNEIFTSTTLQDARFLGTKVLNAVIALDCLCVYVTFIDELTTLSDTIVSMVSAIVPSMPAERTFRIERGPANGLAYAIAVAEKYGVTYEQLVERIAP